MLMLLAMTSCVTAAKMEESNKNSRKTKLNILESGHQQSMKQCLSLLILFRCRLDGSDPLLFRSWWLYGWLSPQPEATWGFKGWQTRVEKGVVWGGSSIKIVYRAIFMELCIFMLSLVGFGPDFMSPCWFVLPSYQAIWTIFVSS